MIHQTQQGKKKKAFTQDLTAAHKAQLHQKIKRLVTGKGSIPNTSVRKENVDFLSVKESFFSDPRVLSLPWDFLSRGLKSAF